jgi:hypothetical protein
MHEINKQLNSGILKIIISWSPESPPLLTPLLPQSHDPAVKTAELTQELTLDVIPYWQLGSIYWVIYSAMDITDRGSRDAGAILKQGHNLQCNVLWLSDSQPFSSNS